MYHAETLTGRKMHETALKDPFGPRCNPEEIKGAVELQIWFSSFTDPGPDCSEFRFIGADGMLLLTKKINGY